MCLAATILEAHSRYFFKERSDNTNHCVCVKVLKLAKVILLMLIKVLRNRGIKFFSNADYYRSYSGLQRLYSVCMNVESS